MSRRRVVSFVVAVAVAAGVVAATREAQPGLDVRVGGEVVSPVPGSSALPDPRPDAAMEIGGTDTTTTTVEGPAVIAARRRPPTTSTTRPDKPSSTTTTTRPTTTTTGPAAQPGDGTWSASAPAPLGPRNLHGMVWTGTEMLVWGGRSGDETAPLPERVFFGGAASDDLLGFLGDGAAYRPGR